MLNLFLYKGIEGIPNSRLMTLFTSENEEEGGLFQMSKVEPFRNMVSFVNEPDQADYIFLPHDYMAVRGNEEYISELKRFLEDTGKKVMLFAYADHNEPLDFDRAVILRPTVYKSLKKDNEIIIPAFIDDLASQHAFESRGKDNEKPVIGFAGMVKLSTLWLEIKFQIKILMARFSSSDLSRLQGLFYRRKAVKILRQSSLVETNFIIRDSYSASKATISDDPEVIRREYIQNLKDCDLGLTIRGNGNYSLRFFELLALGKTPLFLDTDCALPLEDSIEYDSFIVRVDHKDVNKLPEKVSEFWSNISEADYKEMQRKGRETFEQKLKADVFYSNLFQSLKQEA